MGRLIDEDAVKRRMHETMDYQDLYLPVHFEMCMNDAPTVEPASPWHRVEDGLPPKATWVLTVATDGNVKIFNIATVDAGGQWWTYSPQNILRELFGVRYWMPIEPPKE